MERSSRLGERTYWDEAYAAERKNFADFGDEGEIWFGECVLETLLDWTLDLLQNRGKTPETLRLLDIGCGNGHVLFELHHHIFQNLAGIDYSEDAIALCREIAQRKQITGIDFEVDDILHSRRTEKFDVLFDKGTFDAVSLAADSVQQKSAYVASVADRLLPDGLLILTSCNFTPEELIDDFSAAFRFVSKVGSYDALEYSGRRGTTVSSVAFERSH